MRHQDDILARAAELKRDHDASANSRTKVRAILNGGLGAVQALLGNHVTDENLPWPNLMLSGLTRLAQKIGNRPDVRVDPPNETDNENPKKRAERRERIVEAYDLDDRLELQLPQVGRWLPGYGFAVWTIGARLSPEGLPYPHAELRDPYDCYPSAWGVDQQPDELAVSRRITPVEAKRLYPEYAGLIDNRSTSRSRGGVVLGTGGQWSNPAGRGLSIVEFYDDDGLHVLLPDIQKRVAFTSNPLESGPSFVVVKRFSFDRLAGQYDQLFGLLSAIAKINALGIIAATDAVMTETNVFGELVGGGSYQRGRKKTNFFTPGSSVEKPISNLPYQHTEQNNRMERQYRLVAGYPIQDDAQSPVAFATGKGLEELNTSVSNEVREYHKVLKFGLQDIDAKRLEWDDKVSPDRQKPLVGVRGGVSFSEKYRPRTHIKGDYRTRRAYGAMASLDDTSGIVASLQLLGADALDVLSVQENIHGLENLTKINERIAYKKASDALREGLVAAAQQGDMRAVQVLIEQLPEGAEKESYKKFYTPDDPQMSEEEEQFLNGPQGLEALAGGGGLPPDVTTVLSRVNAGGGSEGGVQSVARL